MLKFIQRILKQVDKPEQAAKVIIKEAWYLVKKAIRKFIHTLQQQISAAFNLSLSVSFGPLSLNIEHRRSALVFFE